MKKNTIKAFTLVEMLIVIVIIGILIASLMPRMQSAQGRARDVARKNDLAQIQTAIITSQQDKWEWPQQTTAAAGIPVEWDLAGDLEDSWMTQVPSDPNGDSTFSGIWAGGNTTWKEGKYGYMVLKRNSIPNWWFVLMARTEVEWSSNWVVCDATSWGGTCTEKSDGASSSDSMQNCGIFDSSKDLKDVVLCTKFTKSPSWTQKCGNDWAWNCYYDDEVSLRYILVY